MKLIFGSGQALCRASPRGCFAESEPVVSLPAWCPFGSHALVVIPLSLLLEYYDLWLNCQKCYLNRAFSIAERWWIRLTLPLNLFYSSFIFSVPYACPAHHASSLLLFFKADIFFLHVGIVSSWKETILSWQCKLKVKGQAMLAACCPLQREKVIFKQASVFILPVFTYWPSLLSQWLQCSLWVPACITRSTRQNNEVKSRPL